MYAVGVLAIAGCGDGFSEVATKGAADESSAVIERVQVEALEDPTGVLPAGGVSNFTGDIDRWSAQTSLGTVEYNALTRPPQDRLDGALDDARGIVTVAPQGDVENDMLAAVLEVSESAWRRTVSNPTETVDLVSRTLEAGSLGTVEQRISGSLRTGYVVTWRVRGLDYGYSPCIACDGDAYPGPAFESGGSRYVTIILPPGGSDPVVSQASAGWIIDDPIARGPIVFARIDDAAGSVDVSFVDQSGQRQQDTLAFGDA